MNSANRVVDRLVNLISQVGAFALLALLALIVGNVLLRTAGYIIPGSYELAELIIPVIAGIGVLAATLCGAHVAIDVVTDRLGRKARRRIALAVSLAGALYWLILTGSGAAIALRNTRLGEYTEVLGIPVSPLRWTWVAVCCCVAVYLAASVLYGARGDGNGSD